MLLLDPVYGQEERSITPLFRDTRSLAWDKRRGNGRGGFPPGTKALGGADPLPYRDMLNILRALIKAESNPGQWFEDRAGPFGLHSFRIGPSRGLSPMLRPPLPGTIRSKSRITFDKYG